MKQLLGALGIGVNVSSVLIAICTFGILYVLQIDNWLGISFSVIVGLLAGIIIGQSTEYYTSHSYKPTQKIAKSSETGPATVIISGIGMGMISTAIPVITIAVAIILAFLCAINFDVQHMISAENISKRALWDRYRGGGDALYARDYAGDRRLRPDRRQCGR